MTKSTRFVFSALLVLAVCSFGISNVDADPQLGRVFTYYGCDGTYMGYYENFCGSVSSGGTQAGMFRTIEVYSCDTLDLVNFEWERYIWQWDAWEPTDPPNFPETCP